MKSWPTELNDVLPDGEEFGADGNLKFSWDCGISLAQRKTLRAFLFDLEQNEQFVYLHPELNNEFFVRIEGSARIDVDWNWSEDDSKEKTYWLDMTVAAQRETT